MNKNFNFTLATIYAIFGALSLAIMALFVKLAETKTHVSPSMVIFARFSIGLIYVSILLAIFRLKNKPIKITFEKWHIHLIRAIAGLVAMLLLYSSLKYVSLVNAMLLSTTFPLFIPIITTLMGYSTPYKIWGAIFIGFIGVIFVLQPTSSIFNPKSLYALASGIFAAIALISIRNLSIRFHPYVILFLYFLITTILSAIISIFTWKTPDFDGLILLLFVGIAGIFYQEFLVRSMIYAPSRYVAPIFYLNIVFSCIFDWQIWNSLPNLYSWIGIVIVFIGTFFVTILTNEKNMTKKLKIIKN